MNELQEIRNMIISKRNADLSERDQKIKIETDILLLEIKKAVNAVLQKTYMGDIGYITVGFKLMQEGDYNDSKKSLWKQISDLSITVLYGDAVLYSTNLKYPISEATIERMYDEAKKQYGIETFYAAEKWGKEEESFAFSIGFECFKEVR